MNENNITPFPIEHTYATLDERQDILNAEIARWVTQGWIVQTINGSQAILYKTKRVGLFWNLILTLLTAGLWLFIWLYKILNQKTYQVIINVNEFGNVTYPS